jgi:molybdopterin molybdotransferase
MVTVEEALAQVLARVRMLPAERVALAETPGRTLAEDVRADIANPPFDNAAVDGYAVVSADTAGAAPERPAVLVEAGQVHAGAAAGADVLPGTCLRVMTGAPVPAGADAMVMVEDTRRTEASDGADSAAAGRVLVAITAQARPGDHIRWAGEDVQAGRVVLRTGTRVGPAEVAMMAAMGCHHPSCVRRPVAALLTTGDELVEADRYPGPGQVRNCNLPAMAALAAEAGALVGSVRHVPDDMAATVRALRECAGMEDSAAADVIVASGGVSVGDRDFVKPALEQIGTLDLWRVKMKPGKPLALGRIGGTLFIGLPGNPVSTMVTFELFVRPALWKMAGRAHLERLAVTALLDDPIRHRPGRREYVRAALRLDGDVFRARPTGAQGSGVLSSMIGANCLLVCPDEAGDLHPGEPVQALIVDAGSVPRTLGERANG